MNKIKNMLNSTVEYALNDVGINDEFGCDVIENELILNRYNDNGDVISRYAVTYNITPLN